MKHILSFYETKVMLEENFSRAVAKVTKSLLCAGDYEGNVMLTAIQECTSDDHKDLSMLHGVIKTDVVGKLKFLIDEWEKERETLKALEKKSSKVIFACFLLSHT